MVLGRDWERMLSRASLFTSTTFCPLRPRRRMVPASVQTEECDWFNVLSKLTENAALYECPGNCAAPCLCCMVWTRPTSRLCFGVPCSLDARRLK